MADLDVERGSERKVLEALLDENRAEIRRKAAGLSEADATRRLGVSKTSVSGIVKHLIDVERWWFRHQLDGEEGVPFARSDDVRDLEFEIGPGETLESLLDEYDRACAESRVHASAHDAGDQCVRGVNWREGRRPTLRWVYVHMIEETARHAGHLDIYRELLDGTVDTD